MDMKQRIVGVALIVISAVLALHTAIEPLYHASSEASLYSPIWSIKNPGSWHWRSSSV